MAVTLLRQRYESFGSYRSFGSRSGDEYRMLFEVPLGSVWLPIGVKTDRVWEP